MYEAARWAINKVNANSSVTGLKIGQYSNTFNWCYYHFKRYLCLCWNVYKCNIETMLLLPTWFDWGSRRIQYRMGTMGYCHVRMFMHTDIIFSMYMCIWPRIHFTKSINLLNLAVNWFLFEKKNMIMNSITE